MHYRVNQSARRRARLLGTSTAVALAVALCALPADEAKAAGFSLKEQSSTALGNAFAGATAGAEDVSYMYFNPAGLTRQEDSQAALVLSYIMPQGRTDDATMNPVIIAPGESSSGDAAEDALVPAAYLMWSKSPNLKFGLGINTPLGLSTKYSQTWAGRYDAVESSIMSVNVNPTVAYRVNESLSIGAGVQVQYMDVTLSNMVPVIPPGIDVLAEITGNDWGYGFNLGALYEFSDSTRIGVGYRSTIDHTLEGDLTIAGAVASNANADFTAPDLLSIGAYHDYNEHLAVMAEAQWNGWGNFDELRVVDDGGNTLALTPEDWKNVWFFALGVTWKPNADWTLRGGVAYDQTPVPDNRRTPRLTDEDRTWITIGAQFHPAPNLTVDAGYAHLFINNASVNLPDRTALGGPPGLTANFENSVDILTVQATAHF